MDEKLKDRINRLAHLFYKMHGYYAKEGHDFSKQPHPTEKMMWDMAKISLDFWEVN